MAVGGVEMLTEAEMTEAFGETESMTGIEAEVAAEAELEAEAESTPEAIVEAALEGFETGEAAPEAFRIPGIPVVGKQVLKVLRRYLSVVVKRLIRSVGLRAKLRAACKAGPANLARFLTPLILRALPIHFRLVARPFLPSLLRAAFKAICKQAGAGTSAEMEALEYEV